MAGSRPPPAHVSDCDDDGEDGADVVPGREELRDPADSSQHQETILLDSDNRDGEDREQTPETFDILEKTHSQLDHLDRSNIEHLDLADDQLLHSQPHVAEHGAINGGHMYGEPHQQANNPYSPAQEAAFAQQREDGTWDEDANIRDQRLNQQDNAANVHLESAVKAPATLHGEGQTVKKTKKRRVRRLVPRPERIPEAPQHRVLHSVQELDYDPHAREALDEEADAYGQYQDQQAHMYDQGQFGQPMPPRECDIEAQFPGSPHDQLHHDLNTATQTGYHNDEQSNRIQTSDPHGSYRRHHMPPFTARYQRHHLRTPLTSRPLDAAGLGEQHEDNRTYAAADLSSDIADYAEALTRKVGRKHQKELGRLKQTNASLQNELQDAHDANLSLQDRYDSVEQERDRLNAQFEQQKMKLAGFESKAARFRTFVDGLGNDIDNLKCESNRQRLSGEQSIEDINRRHQTQELLLQQLADGAEKSVQLRNDALRTCQTVKAELDVANTRLTHLQQDVNEKSRLLVEEKDLRTQLERQRQDISDSLEGLMRDVKSNSEAALEKLNNMHTATRDFDDGQDIPEKLEKVMGAIQNLNSTQTSSAEDLRSAKVLIEALSEKVSAVGDCRDEQAGQSVTAFVSEALTNLKADICDQQKLVDEAAAYRETIASLKQKLQASETRIAETEKQLEAAQTRESQLRTDNANLKTTEKKLRDDAAQQKSEIDRLKTDIRSYETSLETAREDLETKIGEYEELQTKNTDLRNQRDAAQRSLDERCRNEDSSGIASIIKAARDEEHAKVVSDSKKLHDAHEAVWQNDIKSAKKARDQALAKLKAVEQQLGDAKAQVGRLHSSSTATESETKKQLVAVEQASEDRRRRIEELEATIIKLENETENTVEFGEYNKLRNQLVEQQGKVEHCQNEIQTMKRDVEEKMQSIKALRDKLRLFEEISDAPETLRGQIRQLQQQCDAAQMEREQHADRDKIAFQKAEAAHKKDAIAAQGKLEAHYRSEIEELQRTIAAKDEEMTVKAKTDQDFADSLDRSWRAEQEQHKEKLQELRDKASAEKALLEEKLAQQSQRVTEIAQEKGLLEEALAAVQSHTDRNRAGQQQPRSSALRTDRIPDSQSTIWKAVDRHGKSKSRDSDTFVEETKFDSFARPVARTYGFSQSDSQQLPGSVVEESQLNLQDPFGTASRSQLDFQIPSSSGSNGVESQLKQRPGRQQAHGGPSFADFNAGRSCTSATGRTRGFSVYEDTRAALWSSQSKISSSQKRSAAPNSGSKRVNVDQRALGTELSTSKPQHNKSQFKTPEPHISPAAAFGLQHTSQSMIDASSSPGFVGTSQAIRPSQQYHGSGSVKKSSLRRKSDHTPAQAPKRKADDIDTGYLAERKRRSLRANSTVTKVPTQAGLRSRSQTENSTAYGGGRSAPPPSSSQISRGSSVQSRMQTLAGGSTLSTRNKKKVARGDEMDTRFTQELQKSRRR